MSINLSPRTATVVLYQGDDLARIDELLGAVSSAVSKGGGAPLMIGDEDPVRTAALAHDEFVTEAEARAVKVDVHPVKRSRWRQLLREHPPRTQMVTETDEDGNEVRVEQTDPEDQRNGFNTETLGDELLPESISLDDGQFADAADVESFIDALDDARYSRLYVAAVRLNRGEGADPKVDLSSQLDRIYATSSPWPTASG